MTVSLFKLWTTSRGLASSNGLGQLNAAGKDTLRVGATLSVPPNVMNGDYGAVVPVTVSYE